jgi:hypothetical protein
MKSVVAEASSIAKALELAWQKAGQPKEFLVKVFQEPQRNMFGLTKTSAKVGIFFDDAALTQKIKNAAHNGLPISHAVKQTPPIAQTKPLDNHLPASKQTKTQSKIAVTSPMNPNEIIAQKADNSVNKNTQAARPSANRNRNNPTSRSSHKPTNVNTHINNTSNNPVVNHLVEKNSNVELELPSEPSLVDQVINLIANESKARNNKQVTNIPAAKNPNVDSTTTPPKPVRKYYHRRKPKSARPNTREGSQQNRTTAPSNKSED